MVSWVNNNDNNTWGCNGIASQEEGVRVKRCVLGQKKGDSAGWINRQREKNVNLKKNVTFRNQKRRILEK